MQPMLLRTDSSTRFGCMERSRRKCTVRSGKLVATHLEPYLRRDVNQMSNRGGTAKNGKSRSSIEEDCLL